MSNIEKIRQEIERRKKICEGIFERESDTYYQGKAVAYGELLAFINSLPEEKPSKDLEGAIKPDFAGCVLDSTKVALLGKTAGKSLLEPHIETMRRQIERKIAELPPAPEGYRYAWKVENYIKEEDAFTVTSNIVLKPIDPEHDE